MFDVAVDTAGVGFFFVFPGVDAGWAATRLTGMLFLGSSITGPGDGLGK